MYFLIRIYFYFFSRWGVMTLINKVKIWQKLKNVQIYFSYYFTIKKWPNYATDSASLFCHIRVYSDSFLLRFHMVFAVRKTFHAPSFQRMKKNNKWVFLGIIVNPFFGIAACHRPLISITLIASCSLQCTSIYNG